LFLEYAAVDTIMTSTLLYIHGLPGSEVEIEHFKNTKFSQIVYVKPFALKRQKEKFENLSHFKVMSFSLGSMTATELALAYPEKVKDVVLVSPAAPLELGNFLPHMDGRFIFEAARNAADGNAALFKLLTYGQGLMARFSPNYLMQRMFGESCEAERHLLKDKQFTNVFQHGLRQSTYHESTEYMQAIMGFTQPWAHKLEKIGCPVEIWHGNRDSWAPISMGKAMATAIGTNARLVECDGLGHYSTLHYALRHHLQK